MAHIGSVWEFKRAVDNPLSLRGLFICLKTYKIYWVPSTSALSNMVVMYSYLNYLKLNEI